MNKDIKYIDWGIIEYSEALAKQEKMFNDAIALKLGGGNVDNVLVMCEHPHVYTLGKSGNEGNMLINESALNALGAKLFHISRGGDIRAIRHRAEGIHSPHGAECHRCLRILRYRGRQAGRRYWGVARCPYSAGKKDLCHRCAKQSLCYDARACAECEYRPEIFPLHQSLRIPRQRGDFHIAGERMCH